ncbi:EamA family transporter RarD [Tropicimonas sp. TH_r6]|uniref:EamA family transporter RarD n=1 Tax=Tropicimonas sp. TH_r6 TaxID=3082085 RepID=UPI0029543E8D|nr:EamA family transporter RarD [Tropicimonas sp. TH_r6]MDV7145018.1 EamA family transporter RarD [Tropicimonas sp. TH_r6]
MSDTQRGILAMLAACTIWGLSPLFYKQLAHVPPLEVLSYRTLWSLGVFGVVLILQRQTGQLWSFLGRRWPIAALAALLISTNWGFYIWSIQVGRAMEASLGYYIFPLVAVLFGALFFGERLGALQWFAVALAATGVLVLTLGLGLVPLVALTLATTFGLYGLIKKQLRSGAIISVTAEVLLLAPLAIVWLGWIGSGAAGGAQALDWQSQTLLALSGPITAGPLILFSYATRKVRLATVGLLQYLNPTLQFLCAALVFGEPFTQWHAITFGLIWAALGLYSAQALLSDRAARRRSINAERSGTV